VSEKILNGTSAQGYTVYHSRWIFWKLQDSRQIEITDNTETKHNLEKSEQRRTQQNKTSLV